MIDILMRLAENPATPWIVLVGAGLIVVFESARMSGDSLWGDYRVMDFDD